MAEKSRAVVAAERLQKNLETAKKGGYYEHGWYGHMRRTDIEVLIEATLNPVVVLDNATPPDDGMIESFRRPDDGMIESFRRPVSDSASDSAQGEQREKPTLPTDEPPGRYLLRSAWDKPAPALHERDKA